MHVAPFLMFEGACEAALNTYRDLLGAEIIEITHWPEGGPGKPDQIMQARFSLCGTEFRASDTYMHHDFTFTPSLSLFLDCNDEAELDRIYAALSEGGGVLMEPANYGFSQKFTWVNDRFGVSWQINLP